MSLPPVITDNEQFAALVDRLMEAPRYAVDTEFHRERTYYPQVALVQLAGPEELALVDPLAVDMKLLAPLLCSDNLAVMHAGRQDLEVLERACGTPPRRIVDTQIAAGFLGYTSPSLASLLERELGVRVPKADRLTDWLRRPLEPRQLDYAASDVAHLLRLYEILEARLVDRGRLGWVAEACTELLEEPRGPRDPAEVWRRIKEIRHLKGADLAVAQAVAAWREERARDLDITPRFVLSDLAVVAVAAARPTTPDQLRGLRGVEARNLKGPLAAELLAVVAESAGRAPRRAGEGAPVEVPPELRAAVPLISAWVGQLARDLDLEAALLATRSDLEDLLRGDPDARCAHGWRAELVGEPIGRLLAGEASVAFARGRGLVFEPRRAQ